MSSYGISSPTVSAIRWSRSSSDCSESTSWKTSASLRYDSTTGSRDSSAGSETPADSGLVPMAWTDNVELLDVTRKAAEDAAAAQVEDVLGADHGATVSVVEGGPAEAL